MLLKNGQAGIFRVFLKNIPDWKFEDKRTDLEIGYETHVLHWFQEHRFDR